jgi:chemotaxis protein MotB
MAAAKDAKQPIIIKKIKKGHHGHHGGAWKIAYADFVTAMMAFFLLMWLLGSTAKGDLNGISEYFQTPLQVALMGGSGAGDATSIIKGGGTDLTKSAGQVKRGEVERDRSAMMKAAKAEIDREDRIQLQKLKERVESVLEANARLRAFRSQIRLDITNEGLRIQIVDELNRPMFDLGSARLKDYTREILREIGVVLNGVDNKLSLAGHTDAKPYAGGDKGYSNWELSADRANASRRELVAAGIDEGKIVRVVGLSSSILFVKDDPQDPANRRISIVVLNRKAEEALKQDGRTLEVSAAEDLAAGADPKK